MSGVRASLAGIEDGMERLGAAGSRIASASVQGYEAQRVDPVPKVAGEVQTQVREDSKDRIDISAEAVKMMEAKHQVGVNTHALKRMNEMHSVLLEIGE